MALHHAQVRRWIDNLLIPKIQSWGVIQATPPRHRPLVVVSLNYSVLLVFRLCASWSPLCTIGINVDSKHSLKLMSWSAPILDPWKTACLCTTCVSAFPFVPMLQSFTWRPITGSREQCACMAVCLLYSHAILPHLAARYFYPDPWPHDSYWPCDAGLLVMLYVAPIVMQKITDIKAAYCMTCSLQSVTSSISYLISSVNLKHLNGQRVHDGAWVAPTLLLIVQQEVSGAAAALRSSKGNTGAQNIILTGACPLGHTKNTVFSCLCGCVCVCNMQTLRLFGLVDVSCM